MKSSSEFKLLGARGCEIRRSGSASLSSPSARLPSVGPLDFDFRKLGSSRLARGRLPITEPYECFDGAISRVEGGSDMERWTLSSVFSSSSHSLSDPQRDPGLTEGDASSTVTTELEATLTSTIGLGLGGMTVTETGFRRAPPSSKSPRPASSRHCTLFPALTIFFSLSETRLYG